MPILHEASPPVIVGLAGIGYGENSDTHRRALRVAELWKQWRDNEALGLHVLLSGAYTSTHTDRPKHPLCDYMEGVVIDEGVDPKYIQKDGTSLTTIQNALNTKPKRLELPGTTTILVTSKSHDPRAMKTFRRTWGPEHTIISSPAPEGSKEKNQLLQAAAGSFINGVLFLGVAPGDDTTIEQRHNLIFPPDDIPVRELIYSRQQVIVNTVRTLGTIAHQVLNPSGHRAPAN